MFVFSVVFDESERRAIEAIVIYLSVESVDTRIDESSAKAKQRQTERYNNIFLPALFLLWHYNPLMSVDVMAHRDLIGSDLDLACGVVA